MENLTPTIDLNALQEKANIAAQKGAEEAIKEFYTGYNSPYMAAIKKNLENKSTDVNFEIHDIIGVINEGLSKEVDKIANTAIAKTFMPLVTKMLTRAPKEINLSEVLTKYIELADFDRDDEDFEEYTIEKYSNHEGSSLSETFFHIKIESPNRNYDLHFYAKDKSKPNCAELCGLPTEPYSRNIGPHTKTMKLSIDGATLEMPFTKDILSDPFMSYCATLVLAQTQIEMDCDDFDESMFPERDHCHC